MRDTSSHRTTPRFAVAVKAAIVEGNRLLILTKSEREQQSGIEPDVHYDLPGGRVEFAEVPTDSLIREVAEETGLIVQISAPIKVWTQVDEATQFQLVGITFACRLVGGTLRLSDEHSNAHWLTQEEIEQKKIDPDGRFIVWPSS